MSTVHKPSAALSTRPPDALSRRQYRWREILSCVDFIWECMKGSTNLAGPPSSQAPHYNCRIWDSLSCTSAKYPGWLCTGLALPQYLQDTALLIVMESSGERTVVSLCLTTQTSDTNALLFITILLNLDISAFLALLICWLATSGGLVSMHRWRTSPCTVIYAKEQSLIERKLLAYSILSRSLKTDGKALLAQLSESLKGS